MGEGRLKSDAYVGPIFSSFPFFKGMAMADRDRVRLA